MVSVANVKVGEDLHRGASAATIVLTVHKHVKGLDIAVHKVALCQVREGLAQLAGHAAKLVNGDAGIGGAAADTRPRSPWP
jgi:hypothetical protein